MARGKISHVETWQRDSTNNVYDKLGHGGLESHDIHGCLIAALLRDMSGLDGKAMFERVESSFICNRCLRQGSVESP